MACAVRQAGASHTCGVLMCMAVVPLVVVVVAVVVVALVVVVGRLANS